MEEGKGKYSEIKRQAGGKGRGRCGKGEEEEALTKHPGKMIKVVPKSLIIVFQLQIR